ncbi:MAG: 30S ribosomal protein S17 [Promethearchaeota archaeon]|nr:MAG: 30S ribosomal protein S17 [Candidatus Lokiarchaeota archaeon]
MARNIGIEVPEPSTECDDPNCPFHGNLAVRGRIFEGKVISINMDKAIVIRRDYLFYLKKYKRYERRHGTISAHCPPCLKDIKIGDTAKIAECRPISKTISYVVVEVRSEENI